MSNLNEQDFAILASKRLKQGGTAIPTLMSMIPNALSNMSRDVANDPFRRKLLLTDKTIVHNTVSTLGLDYYVDLAPLVSTYGLLIEYLELGTIWYQYTLPIKSVDTGADTLLVATTSGLVNGDAVIFTTDGTLPDGIDAGTTYYILLGISFDAFQIYTDPANTGSIVNITSTGSGTTTMQLLLGGTGDSSTGQWLGSPAQAELDPNLPCDYTYIWLVNNQMYTNRTLGTFAFTVPFLPVTVADLPFMLENDLIDNIVSLAMTAGFEPMIEAQR